MDVAEFNIKADLKILELSFIYNNDMRIKGKSCVWKDVYLLSEAIKVVNDEITDTDCIESIISALDCKYQLSDIRPRVDGGISYMTIDPATICNVFTVYG